MSASSMMCTLMGHDPECVYSDASGERHVANAQSYMCLVSPHIPALRPPESDEDRAKRRTTSASLQCISYDTKTICQCTVCWPALQWTVAT